MNPELTPAQRRILQAVVGIYSEKAEKVEAVKSQEIARLINSTPSTVRSQMQVLTSLGLVEGVPGPKGGYRPTYRAYELLFSRTLKRRLEVAISGKRCGVECSTKVERLILTALSDPKKHKAVIKLREKVDLSEGDEICIDYAGQLAIYGTVSAPGEDEVVIDIDRVVAYPREAIDSAASPCILMDSKLTVRDAAGILLKHGAFSGVVVDGHNASGVLTLEHIARAVADGRVECRVGEVCADPVTVESGMPIGKAVRLLGENSRVLIVMENGKIKGVASEHDLLASILRWLS